MFISFKPNQTYNFNISGIDEVTLDLDKEYILHNTWLGSMQGVSTPAIVKEYKIDINLENKKLLFMRTKGKGDILFLSPLIKIIKEKYPNTSIDFCTIESDHDVLSLIPNIDNKIIFPIETSKFNEYDYHFVVANLIELSNNDQNRNVYDVYLEHLGLDPKDISSEYKRPIIRRSIFKEVKDNRIGIHPFATSNVRSLDIRLVNLIINRLEENGFDVVIFSNEKERELNSLPIKSKKCTWSIDKFNDLVRTAEFMRSCKCIIGVDSSIIHLAQGLGIPSIAIYGPFSSHSRVKYYKDITIIDSNPDCRCYASGSQYKCPKNFITSPCLNVDPDTLVNIIKGEEINLQLFVSDPEINFYLGA